MFGMSYTVELMIEGTLQKVFYAEEDCIVIGKASNPVAKSGDRIMHLGVVTGSFAESKSSLAK
jgi:hypothetical protein